MIYVLLGNHSLLIHHLGDAIEASQNNSHRKTIEWRSAIMNGNDVDKVLSIESRLLYIAHPHTTT